MTDAERALFYIWVAGWLSVLWAWLSRKYGNWREFPNTRKLAAPVWGERKDRDLNMNCIKCNKHMESTTPGNNICPDCIAADTKQHITKSFGVAQGWLCPKCGAVLAPNQPYCSFCAPVPQITCGFNPPWNYCGEQAIGAPFDEFGMKIGE